MTKPIRMRAGLLRMAFALPFTAAVCAEDSQSLSQALGATTPVVDIRLRHEEVEQTGIANNADANTLRARLGGKTGDFFGTSLLIEGEVMARLDRYYRPDNAVATYVQYPVVADPSNLVLNRLQLVNKSIPKTTITVGRQVLLLDDQRFVGNSGWRQNEVTFDALNVVNTSIPNLTLTMSAVDRVNRIYGVDSPQGTYKGDSYLVNAGYRLPFGTLTGFAYLLEFDGVNGLTGALDPRRGSTSTTGARLAGSWRVSAVQLGYAVSYASQKPRGDDPLSFDNDYLLAEIKAGWAGLTLTAGEEILHGNGSVGFSTPLATLHLFQGWADKFLTTPPDGIDDRYGSVGWESRRIAGLDSLSASAVYHDYRAERISTGYGNEWDLLLTAKWRRYRGLLKYANYRSAGETPTAIARDTEKFWAQIEYVY